MFQEFPRRSPISLVTNWVTPNFTGAVDADKQVELGLGGLNLGNIHVEEADRVAPEALSLRLVTLDVWQARDAVPLQAAAQRRPCQLTAATHRGNRRVAALCDARMRRPPPPQLR
jgi:hypothetical protein